MPCAAPIRSCSRWGLPCRPCCQGRGALLPHPFTLAPGGPGAVCFLWHFPWGRPRRALPGTVFPWSPDFPPSRPFGTCDSGHPADWRFDVTYMGLSKRRVQWRGSPSPAQGAGEGGRRPDEGRRAKCGGRGFQYAPRPPTAPDGAALIRPCGAPSPRGEKGGGVRHGVGRLASSRPSVSRVDRSARPSTRAGRKWRWKAVTVAAVAASNEPDWGTS
jgi:hypothetical protein